MNDGKTVGIFSQLPPPVHGSTMMTERLTASLSSAGYRVGLLDRRFSTDVSEIGSFSLRKIRSALALLVRTAFWRKEEHGGLVIFFLTTRSFSFMADCLVAGILRTKRIKIVHYVHTNGFETLRRRTPVLRWLVKWVLNRAERVVVLGPSLKGDVAADVADERIVSIPNCAQAGPQRTQSGTIVSVGFLSNLMPEKGPEDFVAVAEGLARAGAKNLRFVMAGHAPDRALIARLSDRLRLLKDTTDINYVGAVSGGKKEGFLREVDILLFPSTYQFEAQPLSLIEAFHYGIPVVAYNVGGVSDLVIDGLSGRLVTAGDLENLQDAVASLANDLSHLRNVQDSTQDLARQKFSIEAYTSAWCRLMDDVSNG